MPARNWQLEKGTTAMSRWAIMVAAFATVIVVASMLGEAGSEGQTLSPTVVSFWPGKAELAALLGDEPKDVEVLGEPSGTLRVRVGGGVGAEMFVLRNGEWVSEEQICFGEACLRWASFSAYFIERDGVKQLKLVPPF